MTSATTSPKTASGQSAARDEQPEPGAPAARARDYAALTATWGLAAGALVLSVDRAERRAPTPGELPVVALATFALARTVSRERVESWLREPFVDERPGGVQRPRGSGARRAIGELLTCTRCTGTWAALGVTAAWSLRPGGGRALVGALAATGANDLLQVAFARACGDR